MIDKISFYTALLTAKTINQGLHMVRRAGTSLPGYTAMKISKSFLSYFANCCEKQIITITGTNGKTTTAGLLAHILKFAGEKVLHNEKGANMLAGIATSLAVGYQPLSKFDYAVLETDEAYLTKLYDYVNVNYLLVTNLFHDQLDRYGELDTTSKKIQEAIEKNKNLVLFVNSDDVMLQDLGTANKRIFYGFDEIIYKNNNKSEQSLNELITCSCGATLSYEKVYYDHIGKYYCENCKRKRPEPDYNAKCFIYDDYSEIVFVGDNSQASFKINLVGLYNAYNALAAISMALEFGIEADLIQQSLDTYQPMFGRAQKLMIDGKNVFVQLIKNPTGASEVLRTINFDTTKNILIAINDNYADGRDVSWLWDMDFELLKNIPNKIVVSGMRAYDVAVRLKYAGVDLSKIEVCSEISEGFYYAMSLTGMGEQLLIMPSYTALLEMQKYLK